MSARRFKKVLIANRGEIAVRIAKTLQEMGMTAAVLCSDADRQALHVKTADEAYRLPGVTAAETYLRQEAIIDLCRAHDVDAVHPGYGFLSENADFARRCEQAGIGFIGPRADVIRAMGDKIVAKQLVAQARVPVVPGWSGEPSTPLKMIKDEAVAIGYPVLVKAAAGGGGKGMRIVHKPSELEPALEAAAREAQSAFGDARIFLEKYIVRPRHVEFQILGDEQGNVVHLFERECSIQRRHQKIIEESPAPGLTPELRQKMGKAAVLAAKAIGYTNAGTVEFILDPDGKFYFLEMNTRLQVEHPVTEWVVRQDLVRLQMAIAQGEPLPFRQAYLNQRGHAIECRIYAEDPARNFMPAVGILRQYLPPSGPGIRVDSGVETGSEVTVHYDPMLAKLIVWAEDRQRALEKACWALDHFVALGVTTNIAFLGQILRHPRFIAGETHTHFLEENALPEGDPANVPSEALLAAALALKGRTSAPPAAADRNGAAVAVPAPGNALTEAFPNPWRTQGSWRAY